MGAQQSMIKMLPAPAFAPSMIMMPPKKPPVPALHRTKPTMPPKDRIAAKISLAVPIHPLAP